MRGKYPKGPQRRRRQTACNQVCLNCRGAKEENKRSLLICLPDRFCREKDMKGGLAATFFCAFPLFPSLSPPFPRRWHTRVALQAHQRRFCVPSVTFLWEWSRECVLEVCLERIGCAIVLSGGACVRGNCRNFGNNFIIFEL